MNCQFQVQMQGMNFYRTRCCKNKPLEGKTYCAVHSPAALKKKAISKDKADKKKDALSKARYYGKLARKTTFYSGRAVV